MTAARFGVESARVGRSGNGNRPDCRGARNRDPVPLAHPVLGEVAKYERCL